MIRNVFLLFFSLLLAACAGRGSGPAASWLRAAAETYAIGFGAETNEVHVVTGSAAGPAVYVVAGLHGDEPAGTRASLLLLLEKVVSGQLFVLPRANLSGARTGSRLVDSLEDLNRVFPGDPEGSPARRAAHAIYMDIADKRPELVLDLHEAGRAEGPEDDLRHSLVCWSLDGVGEDILAFLDASGSGALPGEAFRLWGSPPPGSLNREVTSRLGIPVITVETFREDPLELRVDTQLSAARFFLGRRGLLESPAPGNGAPSTVPFDKP